MKKILATVSLIALMVPTAFAKEAATVNVSALNVRADADITATLLGKLKQGTAISVEGKVLKDTWCRITFQEKEAYVACEYLTFTGTKPAEENPTEVKEETKPAEAAPSTTAPVTTTAPSFPLIRFITVPALNVRSSAAIEDNLVGQLSQGKRVEIMEKTATNWCRIEFAGKAAWISCMYVGKGEVTTETSSESMEKETPSTTTGATMPEKEETSNDKAADTGCSTSVKDFGALTMEVKTCAGQTAYQYGVRGNGVYKHTGTIDTTTMPVLELYAKGEEEPVMDAVMSLVSGTIPKEEQGKCVVRKIASPLTDQSKEVYGLVPTADYQKILDARSTNEVWATACGAYGTTGTKQYFVYQPAESKTIFAFVRPDGSFEPNSIVIR
ncbi:hypothetical protein COW46_02295 [Candidatus Gracilibacteria bacterium CG17_big_fil_post_rev_8_21_14_2_50_48_13]|nr:MAG: hypothetical protein COW46_02295 [Candidatus Gracilibacteria bacterium CG17_big_fil_post_rev_8_21_14_2_50_48_13]